MFIDYYEVLEIEYPSNLSEIKIAYHKQLKIWHPDKNLNGNTHERTILINEAKLILEDSEAKKIYDHEYFKFKQKANKERSTFNSNNEKSNKSKTTSNTNTFTYTFESESETLNKWINNATRQAKEMANQSLEDLIGMSKAAMKEGGKRLIGGFIAQLILGLIVIIIVAFSRSCN